MAAFDESHNDAIKEITKNFTSLDQFKALHDKITLLQLEFERSGSGDIIKALGVNDKWAVFPYKVDISGPGFEEIQETQFSVYVHLEARGRYMDYMSFVEIVDPSWGSYEDHWIDDLFYQAAFPRLNFIGGDKAFALTEKDILAKQGLDWQHNEDHKDPGYDACTSIIVYGYHRKVKFDQFMLYLLCDYKHDKVQSCRFEKVWNDIVMKWDYTIFYEKEDGTFKAGKPNDALNYETIEGHFYTSEFAIFGVKPNLLMRFESLPEVQLEEHPQDDENNENEPNAKAARTE